MPGEAAEGSRSDSQFEDQHRVVGKAGEALIVRIPDAVDFRPGEVPSLRSLVSGLLKPAADEAG